MRRKVIQHFANMFPQRFLDLPEGTDLAVFANEKHGKAIFDFLTGASSIDGALREEMRTGRVYREWLAKEAEAHHVPLQGLLSATMQVAFTVSEIRTEESFGHIFCSALFDFDCAAELRTNEKSYCCRLSGSKRWGYSVY